MFCFVKSSPRETGVRIWMIKRTLSSTSDWAIPYELNFWKWRRVFHPSHRVRSSLVENVTSAELRTFVVYEGNGRLMDDGMRHNWRVSSHWPPRVPQRWSQPPADARTQGNWISMLYARPGAHTRQCLLHSHRLRWHAFSKIYPFTRTLILGKRNICTHLYTIRGAQGKIRAERSNRPIFITIKEQRKKYAVGKFSIINRTIESWTSYLHH